MQGALLQVMTRMERYKRSSPAIISKRSMLSLQQCFLRIRSMQMESGLEYLR